MRPIINNFQMSTNAAFFSKCQSGCAPKPQQNIQSQPSANQGGQYQPSAPESPPQEQFASLLQALQQMMESQGGEVDRGKPSRQIAKGGAGNDTIKQFGGKGRDRQTASGGRGHDRIIQKGGPGADRQVARGGRGNDTIIQKAR